MTSSTNISSVQSMVSKAKSKLKQMISEGYSSYSVKEQELKVQDLEKHLDKLKYPHTIGNMAMPTFPVPDAPPPPPKVTYTAPQAGPTFTLHNVHINLTVGCSNEQVANMFMKAVLTQLQISKPEIKGYGIDAISWTDSDGDWIAEVGIDGDLKPKEKQESID